MTSDHSVCLVGQCSECITPAVFFGNHPYSKSTSVWRVLANSLQFKCSYMTSTERTLSNVITILLSNSATSWCELRNTFVRCKHPRALSVVKCSRRLRSEYKGFRSSTIRPKLGAAVLAHAARLLSSHCLLAGAHENHLSVDNTSSLY